MKKLINISAIIWAVCCYAFIAIIAITTKGMTHDPNFSGGAETPWLIPMLSAVGLGFLSFGLMILFWVISLFRKGETDYRAKYGLTTKNAIFSVIFLTIIVVIFGVAYRNANMGYTKANYNGQQLFDAVNQYRTVNGKGEVVLDQYICDNLVDRYLKVKSGDIGHEGFEEWVANEGIDQRFAPVAELYIKDTATTDEAIEFWNGSPGHRLSLLGDFTVGCAYANEGVGVVILGTPLNQQ